MFSSKITTPSFPQGPYQVVTQDFESSNSNCSANVRRSWAALDKVAAESEGLKPTTIQPHLDLESGSPFPPSLRSSMALHYLPSV